METQTRFGDGVTYCYSDLEGGNVFEHKCPMGQAPQTLTIAGVTLFRDYAAEQGGHRSGDAWADTASWALGVHPLDRLEAEKDASARGVPTQFNENGDPVITSASHFKKLYRAYGMHDKRAYY